MKAQKKEVKYLKILKLNSSIKIINIKKLITDDEKKMF